MWVFHTIEYYSSTIRNEMSAHAETWMNLENIIQSERNQIQKNLFIGNAQNRQIHKRQKVVAKGMHGG